MTPEWIRDFAITPCLRILPARMTSPQAAAMLLAISAQESGWKHRVQVGGPAHGLWQFEQGGGVRGVLMHPASAPYIKAALVALDYPEINPLETTAASAACYDAIQHNDILAAVFARLLLWTLPQALPVVTAPNVAYSQYLAAWRPGKPHPAEWPNNYRDAWEIVA